MTGVKTPISLTAAVRNVMRANRGVDTKPELRIRSLVHRAGLRYSINVRPERGINRRADLVFRSAKVAVFVHGCFWHGCAKHYVTPKRNRKYWSQKVIRNKLRDIETKSMLNAKGWRVLVFWEHQDPEKSASRVTAIVKRRRRDLRS